MTKKDLIIEAATADLEYFINLIQPQRVLGSIHSELIHWWNREDAKDFQLTLLPRDHQKSALMAFRAVHEIVKNPAIRILYISSTSNLATKQLKFMKDILTSDIFRFYWPEMVNVDEGRREKWTETEISVDHPIRKAETVRDPTIFTAGLTTGIVGLHCDIAIMDDVVTAQNALTEDGREKVEQQYALLASIEAAGAKEWITGTRYHPNDLYGTILAKKVQRFDDQGVLTHEEYLYEEFTRQVENIGDGSGEFLWPRQQRKDGRWFGFDREILETKKSQYHGHMDQFRAQYYNDPNFIGDGGISKENFQYYDRSFLNSDRGNWYFKAEKLNVYAAIDFAYSVKKKADYSTIAVIGIDRNLNYYILDIDRFKTDLMSVYFDHILRLHQKWNFTKMRAETTAAQSTIVTDLKVNYIRKLGLSLSFDEVSPRGDKAERIFAILEPKYANKQMWHYLGGLCQTLEEELVQLKPSHDDIKDALAAAVESAIAPAPRHSNPVQYLNHTHSRFGGIS